MNDNVAGWIVSGLSVLPLLLSGTLMLTGNPRMLGNMEQAGFPADLLPKFAVVKMVICLLYLIPQTSFIGAVLITGYMGGAIAAHVRVRQNFVVQALIPILCWIGFGLLHYELMLKLLDLT